MNLLYKLRGENNDKKISQAQLCDLNYTYLLLGKILSGYL